MSHGHGRVIAYTSGAAFIAFGAWGLLTQSDIDVGGWAVWFGGVAVAHDAVLVPCVLLVGALTRRLPHAYRRYVQGALMAGGVTALVAFPFVLGMGRRPDNPSILPLSYGKNLLIVLAVITVLAACIALRHRHRRRADGDE